MPRPKPTRYNAIQDKFVRMEAQGCSRPEILKEVFGLTVGVDEERLIHNADASMTRWRKYPCYEETWKDEIKRLSFAATGKALRKIISQIDNDNDWLANKAANDTLTFGRNQIYGDEERTVTVQIEGMPDLGTPDDNG